MKLLSTFLCCFILQSLGTAFAASWTNIKDREGRKMEAKFIDVEGKSVQVIRRRDGRKFTLEFDKLSEASQKALIAWAKKNLASEIEKELRTGEEVERDMASPSSGGVKLYSKFYPNTKLEIETVIAEIRAREPKPFASPKQHKCITELNIFRFLCGVSYDVELDSKLNDYAEQAAKACEKKGGLSHSIGSYTDKCNLCQISASSGLDKTVAGYIDDFGANNREKRGHRRWCLYPMLDEVGFGESGNYSAMHCMSHGGRANRKSHAYPGMGLFPKEYLLGDGWSLYLTESAPSKDKLTIEIYKLDERPTKSFSWSGPIDGKDIGVKFVATFKNTINFEPAELINTPGIYFVRVSGGGVKEQYVTEIY